MVPTSCRFSVDPKCQQSCRQGAIITVAVHSEYTQGAALGYCNLEPFGLYSSDFFEKFPNYSAEASLRSIVRKFFNK